MEEEKKSKKTTSTKKGTSTKKSASTTNKSVKKVSTDKKKSTPKKTTSNKKTNETKSTKNNSAKKSSVKIKKVENEEKNDIKEIKEDNIKVNEVQVEKVKFDDDEIIKAKLVSDKTTEYYNLLGKEKSHIFLKIIIFILLILLGLFIVYKYVIRDSKAIFTSGINTIYEKLANNIIKLGKDDIFKDNIDINGVLTLENNDNNFSDLSNYRYNFDFTFNKGSNNYKLNLDIRNNNNSISSFDYYYLNNNYYLDLGKAYNKTILLKNDIMNFDSTNLVISKIDFNKLNYSAKSIKNIINSNIDRNKLIKGEETINGTKFEYVELNLNNKEFSDLVSKIIDEMKDNNSLINNLKDAFNIEKEKIISELDKIQKDNLVYDFNNISFKYYTEGFMANIVGFQIKTDDNTLFYYFDYKHNNKCDNCTSIFKIILNYKNHNILIDKINDKYNVIIKKDNVDYLQLVFNEFNDETIDVNYKYLSNNNYGNVHIEKYNKEKNKSGNIKFSLVIDNNKYSYNIDYIIEDGKNVNLSNNNYISVDELSEDDYLNIENNIENNINNIFLKDNIINIFEKIYNY